MISKDLKAAISSLPKADLHVHFEGTVTPDTLLKLAKRNGVDLARPIELPGIDPISPPVGTVSGEPLLNDFLDFIGLYLKVSETIVTSIDIVEIGEAYAAVAKEENILASQIYFTPSTFTLFGRDMTKLFRGLAEVQHMAATRYGTEIRWIFDIVRNGKEDGSLTLAMAEEARVLGVDVVAIGLAGYELSRPAEIFTPSFQEARRLGYHTLAHAGETGDANSIREVLAALQPERLGHGISVVQDQGLLSSLVEKQLPFEVCPWSNIFLNIVAANQHPLRQMIEAGLQVLICSDDPGIFRKTLNDNYYFAHEQGVSFGELQRIAERSLLLAKC